MIKCTLNANIYSEMCLVRLRMTQRTVEVSQSFSQRNVKNTKTSCNHSKNKQARSTGKLREPNSKMLN
jgi:hypothetical protein